MHNLQHCCYGPKIPVFGQNFSLPQLGDTPLNGKIAVKYLVSTMGAPCTPFTEILIFLSKKELVDAPPPINAKNARQKMVKKGLQLEFLDQKCLFLRTFSLLELRGTPAPAPP